VNWLTRQEQLLIAAVAGMLLVGLIVKYHRTAHPPAPAVVAEAQP
jgi:hypothetical protein